MLTIQNLTVSFDQNKILSDISFDIPEGGTVGIIGPNGSGKTTLFNALCGYVSCTGKVIIAKRDISSLHAYERARAGICRVFQSPGIFKQLSLEENLFVALSSNDSLLSTMMPIVGKRKAALAEQAMFFLEQVGLQKNPQQKAGLLSGGQMRLLEMARAIAVMGDVYLLDEPTAGVSPKLKEQVSEAIQKIISLKKVVLVIEHDMNFIRSFVDRIIVLDQGVIFMDDCPENVMKSERLKEIYFGTSA